MSESLDPAKTPERPGLERRRSRNPIKNIIQHLSPEPSFEDDDGREPRKESLIRRISWRKSRSPSAHSDRSSTGQPRDPDWCKSCANWAIDIDTTFQEMDASFAKAINPGSADAFDKTEHYVARLRNPDEELNPIKCPLCNLFWSVHVPGDGDEDYVVSGFSSRDMNYLIESHKMFEMGHAARGNVPGYAPAFLGAVPKKRSPNAPIEDVHADCFRGAGMIYRALPEGSGAELLSPLPPSEPKHSRERSLSDAGVLSKRGIWGREMEQTIDMAVGQEWLRFCEFYHQGRCGRWSSSRELPGFRLLDCAASPPQVVETSILERYVALSYVWGRDTQEAVPKVVRDAIYVTKAMGLRYLWVDRLCVDERRPEEKMQHIRRMDEIFEGAVFTIIAACGEDATYGLPGVGGTPRPPQPKYKFPNSNITLVSSLQDPRLSIKNSAWYKRGWTYQEGLLARRRLIFTDQQMYWECEGMCCPESLVLPLEFYQDTEEQRMCDFMRPGLFNGVSFIDGSWERWKRSQCKQEESSTLSIFREMDQHIINYTKRHLTYDEDSLNAFVGICRRLEKTVGRGKMVSILGIPVWTPLDEKNTQGPPRTRDVFALSTCCWHHKDGVAAKRLSHMPSWTWAGWSGAVELFSSIVVADPDGKIKDRKYHNHHYVAATHVTRNDVNSLRWTYSPDIVLLNPNGSIAYDFNPIISTDKTSVLPPNLLIQPYAIHVPNPFVLDKVKARTHPGGGWIFNNVSVDVRFSSSNGGAPPTIREYIEAHARAEQMTVLWFIEEATVMLLVVAKKARPGGRIGWERIGRMRMGFAEEAKDVMRRYERLEKMVEDLPLRRLGQDIVIE